METIILTFITIIAIYSAIKITSWYKYLGLSSVEAISLSILTSFFMVITVGKLVKEVLVGLHYLPA
ncbi:MULTISPECIES: hypothetical protein [Flammeovirga]|uniref:Uncharacterized protein n=1 Tax=Flammeovirga agarivorans TaxID=2726742 RepID=A0A7X8XUX9_9BACT|nr:MULTISPECIES: hypothetical protein [Flammeovirga]NLR90781.1 hypothetical protein [Flammeovirga agarivorans]